MNEGYLPLYRKYRPQKLEDIVGQTHIKTALTNAINLNKIAHAYLFTGPRGTGKTSTARILAKSLNCINGPTVTPCEECESCKAITNTVPIDVIEMDAASNRSVDDAHEILEKVNYAPVHGKYKIYIIDEVHMLTPQAFNALLKTLEEPPKNVIFILATTESHKVMDTIKSRCQRFDFKRITTDDIITHLKKIAKKENIKISDSAISVIAKSSAGGMRDSLALLDQVSNIGVEKEITEEDINNLLGRLSFDSLSELAKYIISSDGAASINLLEKIYNDGNEPIQILNNLMLFFKNMLIVKTCDKESSFALTGLTDVQINVISELNQHLEKHQIVFLINKTADYIKELKETTNQQMWLEVALIDLSNLSDNTKLSELEARISRLESGQGVQISHRPKVVQQLRPQVKIESHEGSVKPPVSAQNVVVQKNVQPSELDKQEQLVTHAMPSKPINNDVRSLWIAILQAIPNGSEQALFKIANPVKVSEEQIVITFKAPNWVEKANNSGMKKCIVDAAEVVLGKPNIPVLVRTPLPDDEKFEKIVVPAPKKSIAPPKDLTVEDDVITDDVKETIEEQSKTPQKTDNTEDSMRSDQSNMVKDLFDGKFLD